MNSRDYWAKREEEALKHYITEEKEYEKQINQIYSDMLVSINEQINGFYGRYASKEGITLAEAKKRVSKLDIAAYERKAEKYVKEKDFSAKANEEMRLYNATMKINRLEMLKANIGLEMIAGHDELDKFMAGILKGRTMDELQRQAGILGKTVLNNAKKADAIVNGSFKAAKVGSQSTFSDRIWQYQDLMREDLGKLLQTGLIQGKNPRAIAKDLRKYWYGNDPKTGGGAEYCMERLMRTELARVQTEAQKQAFIRNGFDKYIFIVNAGCCGHCEELSKKDIGFGKGVFLVKDMMPGENAPPIHPNDRCSTAAYEDDAEYEAWLNYLESGKTTAEWNKSGRAAWERSAKLLEFSKNSSKIEIDELTPCLRRMSDNKIVDTTVYDISPTKRDFKDWEFDWTIPQKDGFSVRALKADGDDRIQGLIAIKPNPKSLAVLVDIVEAAPFNNPHNKHFVKKEYNGVGGHLFAEAVRESYKQGFGGAVYFVAKSDLIEHYKKELGAVLTNPRLRVMFIDEEAAQKLYDRYYGGERL